MTIDELKQFATTYESIEDQCRDLFYVLETLEAHYKLTEYGMYGHHHFDGFAVDEDRFVLNGRWAAQGDWSETEYPVQFEQFINREKFIKEYENRLIERKRESEKKEQKLKEEAYQREYKTYLELKEKYEGMENGKV